MVTPMKYLFLVLFSFQAFSQDSREVEAIYSSAELADRLDYSTIEAVQYKGDHRYLIKTANCQVFVDIISEAIKIHKVSCWVN
jgi:hypothetical protein